MFAVQYDRLWPDPGALRWSVMFAVQYDRLWPDPGALRFPQHLTELCYDY